VVAVLSRLKAEGPPCGRRAVDTPPQEKIVAQDHSRPVDADAVFGRLLGVLNSGMLALMISVGDRTGLFRTMRIMRNP